MFMAKEPTAIERIKQLDEERMRLLDHARKEALDKAGRAVDELNNLGFSYRLVESGARGGSSRKGTRRVKDAACPICGFKTIPPHDGRAHRSQSPKKPFTADELAARGFRKA
jgi:hypothetical protein